MHETPRKVFLSYARDDREFASTLKAAFSEAGVRTFDGLDVTLGDDFIDAVLGNIRASDIFVFVVPEREGIGKNALAELGAARAVGKQVVSLVPDRKRAANSDVAVRLSNLMVLDAAELAPAAVADRVLSVAKPELAAG